MDPGVGMIPAGPGYFGGEEGQTRHKISWLQLDFFVIVYCLTLPYDWGSRGRWFKSSRPDRCCLCSSAHVGSDGGVILHCRLNIGVAGEFPYFLR